MLNDSANSIKNSIRGLDGVILLLFGLYGIFSHHFFLSVFAGFALTVMIKALWKPHMPPVILFFLSFHWVQVFSSIIYADVLGKDLDSAYNCQDTEFLLFMTFSQIVIMALVMSHYMHKVRFNGLSREVLKQSVERINVKNVIISYFIAIVILPIVVSFSASIPSLYQLAQTLNIVKILLVAILLFVFMLTKSNYNRLIVGVLIFDFVLSFASFFSDFKVLLFVIIIIYFTVYPKIKPRFVLRIAPAFILIFVFFSFWSYVKGDYRQFLNQGSRMQEIKVSNTDALLYLFGQTGGLDLNALQVGGEIFLSRVQYMERYTEVYKRVPSKIEHRGGEDLESVLTFLLVPRALNPNKGVKDASIRTSYYTGKNFSSAIKGTSISMGYFCDMYIDYGLYFMFIPLILIAVLLGSILTYVLKKKNYNIIFLYSLLIGFFLSLGTFESDTVFFLGAIRNSLAFLILGFMVGFSNLQKYLLSPK